MTRLFAGAKLIKRAFCAGTGGKAVFLDPAYNELTRKRKVAGARAAQKALLNDLVEKLYVAKDAEERITRGVVSLAEEKGVQVVYVGTMKELGEFAGLRVAASVCAILKAEKSQGKQGN
ncbi:MAG TPA: hypothetical protein GXX30_05795 [Firmicutes bacterium]|nr:hypothetical protein [Candidatus Fermentithermobacillaceae bacterium]